jgi:serine/threonine protein kinase
MGLLFLNEFNDLTRARECFSECLRVDPNNSSAYVSMGQMCERQKEWRAAEQYYDMSIQCDSRNPIGYFRLGSLKLSRKEFAQARQQFELAVKANPSDVRFLVKLAKVVEAEPFNDYYCARKCYRTALHHNPEESWIGLRILYIEDKLIPHDEQGNPIIPEAANALFEEDMHFTPLGSAIDMIRQTSSSSDSGASLCPRRHPMIRIAAKPLTYKPQATWACEECHKSIGGLDLRINGALHCAICKYDLCSTCAGKPKTAHVIPDEPTLIGSGGFGEVYREYDPVSETYVAVKYVRTPNHQRVSAVQREVRLMRLFESSPYIVRVLRLEVERHQCRVYLELMAGSVATQIDHGGPVHETQARIWVHDALCGLATLHNATRPVLHRDIKPENLLLSADGRLKLSDFGLSKNADGNTMTAAQTIGPKGTPLYVAPECYSDEPKFTYACDIWGLACAWVCMVTGYHPWHGIFESNARFENIAFRLMQDDSVVPNVPSHLTPEAQTLLRRMLERDRRKRPTAEMILADDYFSRTDLLQLAEPVEEFEARRLAFLQETRGPEVASTMQESGALMVADGVSLITPATPNTAQVMLRQGLFPAIDTSSVIAAPASVPSWGSVTDLTTPVAVSPARDSSTNFSITSTSWNHTTARSSNTDQTANSTSTTNPSGPWSRPRALNGGSIRRPPLTAHSGSSQPKSPPAHVPVPIPDTPSSTQRSALPPSDDADTTTLRSRSAAILVALACVSLFVVLMTAN